MSALISAPASSDLKQLAFDVVAKARKAGASDAEAVVYEGEEFGALVRLGQVEQLKESGSRAVGLRVFFGQRTASTSSSDFSLESIERLVSGAVALAKVTSEDPFAGLPEVDAFGQVETDQHLYFEDVNEMPPAERIEIARRSEAAAMAYDTRITNSGGGDFDTSISHKIMVNSRGFVGEYRKSYCGFSASPIAQGETGGMQRNYWYSNSRTTRLLESPEDIGQEAARRTLKRLGARQVKTQAAPVVFSPEIARSIMGNIFEAANGDAIYRHASFFADMLGERVAGENITVVDDGTMVFDGVGGFGTSPFDGEGAADEAEGDRRARDIEELRDEHVYGAEAGDGFDGECVARAGRESGNRRRELLSRGRNADSGRDYRGREERSVCDGDDGIRGKPGDRGLFAGCERDVDRERRDRVSG